jgi:hypothetical protein
VTLREDEGTGQDEVSGLTRLSENAKFKKSGIDIKGLMTRKFAKTAILGQPVTLQRRA